MGHTCAKVMWILRRRFYKPTDAIGGKGSCVLCWKKQELWGAGAISTGREEMKAGGPGAGKGLLMRCRCHTKPRLCWSWHRCCCHIPAHFGEESEHIAGSVPAAEDLLSFRLLRVFVGCKSTAVTGLDRGREDLVSVQM